MTSIAIVIATYNGAATLESCLDSIRCQTVPVDELIVMDGASHDGTKELLEQRSHELTFWQSEPDDGIYDAWNKALPKVRSKWVWFIGCDDRIADAKVVERLHAALAKLPANVGVAYGKVAMVSAAGRVTDVLGGPWAKLRRRMKYCMAIPHTGMLARSELFERIGGFRPAFRIAGDYEWTRRALRRCEAAFLDDLLVLAGDQGLSGASLSQATTLREIAAVCAAEGEPPSLPFRWLLFRAEVKSWLRIRFGPAIQGRFVDAFRIATLRRPRGGSR
ncbi:glycosyltransferase family 2 protein [Phenylobacterium sp. VNQ135]|uniref:glycosyltransferase family 2 protein n=1 Tax=Phenylobacterium sp. VNQ135 TaxID=3400922 RepID=UPI003C0CB692